MKIGQIPLASIIHFATLGKTITSEKCNSSTCTMVTVKSSSVVTRVSASFQEVLSQALKSFT